MLAVNMRSKMKAPLVLGFLLLGAVIAHAQQCTIAEVKGVVSGPQRLFHTWAAGQATQRAAGAGVAVNINITAKFSGPAQDDFVSRVSDFGTGDIPLEARRIQVAGRPVVTVPIVLGATAFYTSYNTSQLKLDGCTLAHIYSGQITTWDDPAIIKLNPDFKPPAGQRIRAIARSDASNFTTLVSQYFEAACPNAWDLPANQTLSWASHVIAPAGNGGILGAVRNDTWGICFLDPGTGAANRDLAEVAIQNAGGQYVTTRSPGAFSTAGFSLNRDKIPKPGQPWTGIDLVYEAHRNRRGQKVVPDSARGQHPIIFLGFAFADWDMRGKGAQGIVIRDYLSFVLEDAVQQNTTAHGFWPLTRLFLDVARNAVGGIKVKLF